jgi:hypothetical protein
VLLEKTTPPGCGNYWRVTRCRDPGNGARKIGIGPPDWRFIEAKVLTMKTAKLLVFAVVGVLSLKIGIAMADGADTPPDYWSTKYLEMFNRKAAQNNGTDQNQPGASEVQTGRLLNGGSNTFTNRR